MTPVLYGSLARIADLESHAYEIAPLGRELRATGDYVVGEVTGTPTELYKVEDTLGKIVPALPGNQVVGAFGERAATLEGVGSWKDVQHGEMHAMTSAGLFGRFTSVSRYMTRPMSLEYVGHVVRAGRKVRMQDFALTSDNDRFTVPTVLLVGTSMSAGKTVTGRILCEILASAGLKVIGAKLTGAGRYRDVLSFRQAGAMEVYDFVDVGLPSTVVPEDEFRAAIRPLLQHIDSRRPDLLVAEAGASPLEPYNGEAAMDELGDNIRCTVLCASDPYAVVGVQKAFGLTPDLVAGPATNTSAAIALVTKLAGVPALNVVEPATLPALRELLAAKLGVAL